MADSVENVEVDFDLSIICQKEKKESLVRDRMQKYGGPQVQNKTFFQNRKSLCFKTNVSFSKQMCKLQNKCLSFKTNV